MDGETVGLNISVIVPVRNEAPSISACLASILGGTLPPLEVLVIDGCSDDATAEIVQRWSDRDPRVRLLENPARIIPAALNIGWRSAVGEIIVRVDGHAAISPNYLEVVARTFAESPYEGVGGQKRPVASTRIGRIIAAAMSSPWGVGNSRYHYATEDEETDHVPFGCYRRSTIERLGGWDEQVLVNQDYEFDYRLRAQGGRILLVPSIYTLWACSSNLVDLAHQYRRYGRGKAIVSMLHPSSIRARHLAPPLLVLSESLLFAAALILRSRRPLIIGALYPVVLSASIRSAPKGMPCRDRALFPVIAATMHLSQGVGFLGGLIRFRSSARTMDRYRPRRLDLLSNSTVDAGSARLAGEHE